MTGFRFFLVAWLISAVSVPGSFAAPIGMVCAMKGHPVFNDTKPLRLLQDLVPDDRIRCDKESEATVVIFGNGHRYVIENGKSGVISSDGVAGAKSLGGMKGPSAETVKNLAGSRTGAQLSRIPIPIRREYKTVPDWLPEGERHLSLISKPIKDAVTYQFTMYDSNDNAVVTQIVSKPDIHIPSEINLRTQYPYVWHLTGTKQDGTACQDHYWGVLSFLPKSAVDALKSEEATLNLEAKQNPADTLPLTLLARLYHVNGMLLREMETLEDMAVNYDPKDPAGKLIEEAAETVFIHEGGIGRQFSGYYRHHNDPSTTDL